MEFEALSFCWQADSVKMRQFNRLGFEFLIIHQTGHLKLKNHTIFYVVVEKLFDDTHRRHTT